MYMLTFGNFGIQSSNKYFALLAFVGFNITLLGGSKKKKAAHIHLHEIMVTLYFDSPLLTLNKLSVDMQLHVNMHSTN